MILARRQMTKIDSNYNYSVQVTEPGKGCRNLKIDQNKETGNIENAISSIKKDIAELITSNNVEITPNIQQIIEEMGDSYYLSGEEAVNKEYNIDNNIVINCFYTNIPTFEVGIKTPDIIHRVYRVYKLRHD